MRRVAAIAFTLVLSLAGTFKAQTTNASVTGRITDPSKAEIPNATVTVINMGTNIQYQGKTNERGSYYVTDLPVGSYRMEVEKLGFQSVVKPGMVLHVQEIMEVNFEMALGSTAESVTVRAESPTVELASSTISDIVDSTTVRELPLNGRDWTSLATLEVGISIVRSAASTGSGPTNRGNRGFGLQLSDSGHRPYENSFRVNGVNINDYMNSGPGSPIGVSLGVDAIQEFSVLTTNYSAEYGRTSGAVVNAVMKAGINSFHGGAFWFLRNSALDARNYFDPPQIPEFRRNQFGASIGGPIRKDKVFIFFDYEGIRQNKSLSFSDNVPSVAARAGNLCSIPTGVTPACTPTTITVDPKVTPFFGLYPLPNAGVLGNGDVGVFQTSGSSSFSENYETARGDYKISNRDSLVVIWLRDKAPYGQPDSMLNELSLLTTDKNLASLEEAHTFGTKLVNTVRFAYSRSFGGVNVPGAAINPAAADTSLAAIPGRFSPIVSVPGLSLMQGGIGSASFTDLTQNSIQFYDDAFLNRGDHLLKFGFSFEMLRYATFTTNRANGFFAFPSLFGFLTNQPTSVVLPDPQHSIEAGTQQTVFSVYLQDDWRVRSNLTLNLGVRYEPTTNPTEHYNRMELIRNLADGPIPVNNLFVSNPTLKNFAPRVGFSWDPFHDGKTAVRGGFGIYDILLLPWMYGGSNLASSLPFAVTLTGSPLPQGSFPDGALTFLGGFNLKNAQAKYIDTNAHQPYSMTWNLNIERQVTPSLTAMIGYVGSHTVHNYDTPDNMNMVLPTLTSAGYLWPFPVGSGSLFNPNVGSIRGTTLGGSARYEGSLLKVTKIMSHGFQAQGGFTWGKCFDDGSSGNVGDPFVNSIASPLWFDPNSRLGYCDFNQTKNITASFVWEIPTPKFGGVAAEHILGGWEVGGIVTASTGSPFTLLIGGDPVGMKGDPWPFPDRVSGPGCANPVNPGNVNDYVKLNCFTPPVAPPSFAAVCQPAAPSVAAGIPNTCMNLNGNAGRNQITGPGLAEFNFSLFKNNYVPRISETFNVQLRAEFFNVFNHPNFQSPVDFNTIFNQDGTSSPGAGRIDSTTTESRQIQFGIKINF